MSVEVNEQIIDRYFREILNETDLGKASKAIDELVAPDCIFSIPTLPKPFYGPAGYKNLIETLRIAFPDLVFTSVDRLTEGDVVVDRWMASGTHKGTFISTPPSGRTFTIEGIGWYRLKNGQFVENRVNEDSLGLLQQIGAVNWPNYSVTNSSPLNHH